MECGCHCIKCKSTKINFNKVGKTEKDGYYDMHHTCLECGVHFDHLDGTIFDSCDTCGYQRSLNQEK